MSQKEKQIVLNIIKENNLKSQKQYSINYKKNKKIQEQKKLIEGIFLGVCIILTPAFIILGSFIDILI